MGLVLFCLLFVCVVGRLGVGFSAGGRFFQNLYSTEDCVVPIELIIHHSPNYQMLCIRKVHHVREELVVQGQQTVLSSDSSFPEDLAKVETGYRASMEVMRLFLP